jgi:hypothetical protein
VYEGIINSRIKLKSQTTKASNTKKIEKKTPLTFLGRWGRFKKEIIKLSLWGGTYNITNCNSSSSVQIGTIFSMNQHLIQFDPLT